MSGRCVVTRDERDGGENNPRRQPNTGGPPVLQAQPPIGSLPALF